MFSRQPDWNSLLKETKKSVIEECDCGFHFFKTVDSCPNCNEKLLEMKMLRSNVRRFTLRISTVIISVVFGLCAGYYALNYHVEFSALLTAMITSLIVSAVVSDFFGVK